MSGERALLGAVELGGSKVLCAVGPSSEDIIDEVRIPTRAPAETLTDVEAFFERHGTKLAAVGVASFGPLELDPGAAEYGALLATPKPGWSAVPIASRLRRALNVPIAIDTDVNAAALAEQQLGAARDADPCVYITVGTGIGVGVVHAGRPLHGLLHPELGHLFAPALCSFEGCCPFHGRCIEGVASARAITSRTGTTPEALADDHPVWKLEAAYLAHLVYACVLAHSPHAVVLGGGVLARRGLREAVREQLVALNAGYLPRRELTHEGVGAYLRAPRFEQRAGLVGAFLLAEQLGSTPLARE